ncbi:MAG: DUF4345 domain-containing protein, partial [Gammaproteobacteria bacterium]
KLARVVLLFTAFSFIGYGLTCLFLPDIVGTLSGLGLQMVSGRTEIHAMYGGLQTGLGLFFLLCGMHKEWVRPGTVAIILAMGGLALARTYGISVQGSPGSYNLGAASYEALTALFGLIALRLLAKGERQQRIFSR